MVRKFMAVAMVLAFVAFASTASANETLLKAGDTGVCENASWIAYNTSETDETNFEFDIGPHAYGWGKVYKREIPPGGYQIQDRSVPATPMG